MNINDKMDIDVTSPRKIRFVAVSYVPEGSLDPLLLSD